MGGFSATIWLVGGGFGGNGGGRIGKAPVEDVTPLFEGTETFVGAIAAEVTEGSTAAAVVSVEVGIGFFGSGGRRSSAGSLVVKLIGASTSDPVTFDPVDC